MHWKEKAVRVETRHGTGTSGPRLWVVEYCRNGQMGGGVTTSDGEPEWTLEEAHREVARRRRWRSALGWRLHTNGLWERWFSGATPRRARVENVARRQARRARTATSRS